MTVGKDAMTIKSSGTTTVSNIEGYDADDKFFQINAASTLNVTNCIIHRRATLTNSRLHDAGTVCIGPWPSCTQAGNTSS